MSETKVYTQSEYKKFMEDLAYWEVQLEEKERVYRALIASSDVTDAEKEAAAATHEEDVTAIREKIRTIDEKMQKHEVEPYTGSENGEIKRVSEAQLLSKMKELAERKLDLEKNKKDISSARAYGDLSENSEYTEAKKEQEKLNNQVAELEEEITHAVLITDETIDYSKVSIGAYVAIKKAGETKKYHIVGSYETNPLATDEAYRPISDESPIGAALLGHGEGETVTAVLANGTKVPLLIEKVSHETPKA